MKSIFGPLRHLAPLPLPDEQSWPRRLSNVQWGPLIAALALGVMGILNVSSATSELGPDYGFRQIVWVGLGVVMLIGAIAIDYRRIVDLSPLLYGLAIVALIGIQLLGHEAGGARSWIGIGGFGGQPSEFAKLFTILVVARFLAGINKQYLDLRELLIVLLLISLPMGLIISERDLGGAAIFVPMVGAMVLVAGIRWQWLALAAAIGVVMAFGAWEFALKDYQKARVISYLSPESDPQGSGYQVRQSLIAVGSGQWTGRGYGQGTQSQLRFLPARHTDFIVAVLAEEWGFIGALAVLFFFALYIGSAANIATRSRDRTGVFMITGIVAALTVHVIYNMSMVVGLLPITGIPLPFLSYGGSFMLINFAATGLILNVDFRRFVNR